MVARAEQSIYLECQAPSGQSLPSIGLANAPLLEHKMHSMSELCTSCALDLSNEKKTAYHQISTHMQADYLHVLCLCYIDRLWVFGCFCCTHVYMYDATTSTVNITGVDKKRTLFYQRSHASVAMNTVSRLLCCFFRLLFCQFYFPTIFEFTRLSEQPPVC